MNLDVDVAIVIGFFVVTLFIALQHGGGIKTINEYALGDRKFSTATLVSTIVATWISGSLFFTDLSKTYSDGLLYIIPSFCMPFSLLITAYVFVPRMGEFLGKLSVAEVMGSLYGKEVRLITAICGIIGNIGGLAIQFKVFGTLFHYFLGIPEEYALFLASALVTAYSAFGGIKSVTYTDIIQFFTFSFVIPVIGIIVWNHFTSLDLSLANAFQNSIFSFREVLNVDNPRFWEMVFLAFYFAVPAIGAMDFQRISMARNIAQIKLALIISTVLVIFISLSISWIPFLVFNIDQSINPNELFAYLVDNYSYTGFKGFMIIGIAAMAMSTADSRINAVSVLAAHDLGKVIDIKVNSLIVSKISSVLFGLFAVYLALSENDLLAIIMMSASFYMPIITVPLTLSILGFRSTKQVVLIGMGAAFISVILWDYLGTGIHKIIPSMIVNLFFIFSSHYLFKQKGGWVGIKDKSYLDEARKHRKQHRGVIMSDIRNFNIFKFCLANSPKMDVMYSFFGIFCFISTLASIYSTHSSFKSDYSDVLLFLYQTLLVISSFFLLYVVWSPRIRNKQIISVVWNITLIYVLCFCSTFFLLLSNFGKLQLVVFTLNITILFSLTRWKIALVMISIGIICAVQLYKYYLNIEYISDVFDYVITNVIYILLLFSTTLITVFKPKQEHLEATEQKVGTLETEVIHYNQRISDQEKEIHRLGATAQKILNNVNHELRLPIGNVVNFAEMLNEGLEKYSKGQLKELSDEVLKNSTRLSSMILNMLDLATLSARTIELQKKTLNLGLLVEERVKTCRNIYLQKKKIDFELSIAQNLLIDVDPNYMRQTVDNLVINAITFSEKGVIKISVTKQQNVAVFVITNEGKPIPHTELHDIFTAFRMASNTESKAEGRGVGLALCKAAIEAHGGMIKAENTGKGAKFRFVLPL